MPVGFSVRLLSLLQLTRMALVFTAVADSMASLLLLARSRLEPGDTLLSYLGWGRVIVAAGVSVSLYGFGMSLNDIIDRRRDAQLAAHRPLPSGRIGVRAAHVVCWMLALSALIFGLLLAMYQPSDARRFTIELLLFTAALIVFYDFAGKYMVAPGLLTLGLIRFFHATIAAPQLPLLWHPLLLLNHIAIVSTVCYALEEKRPPLTRLHWLAVAGGLALVDAVCIALVWWRRGDLAPDAFRASLWVAPGLLLPVGAGILFLVLAGIVRRITPDPRLAGQNIMLYGLLWLIVYDACFVAGYVGWVQAGVLLLLLPAAYFSLQLMRAWSRIVLLSQKPQFQRAR